MRKTAAAPNFFRESLTVLQSRGVQGCQEHQLARTYQRGLIRGPKQIPETDLQTEADRHPFDAFHGDAPAFGGLTLPFRNRINRGLI